MGRKHVVTSGAGVTRQLSSTAPDSASLACKPSVHRWCDVALAECRARQPLGQDWLGPSQPLSLASRPAAGKLPVDADLSLQVAAPLEAIDHALEEALDDALVPASRSGKTARTTVSSLGLLGAQLALADAPERRALPADPALRLDSWCSACMPPPSSRCC